jgi:hypothetical protein
MTLNSIIRRESLGRFNWPCLKVHDLGCNHWSIRILGKHQVAIYDTTDGSYTLAIPSVVMIVSIPTISLAGSLVLH